MFFKNFLKKSRIQVFELTALYDSIKAPVTWLFLHFAYIPRANRLVEIPSSVKSTFQGFYIRHLPISNRLVESSGAGKHEAHISDFRGVPTTQWDVEVGLQESKYIKDGGEGLFGNEDDISCCLFSVLTLY